MIDDVEDAVDRLVSSRRPQEIFDATVEAGRRILHADTCEIAAIEDGEPTVLAREATDPSIDPNRLPIAADIVGQTDIIGSSHVYDDIADVRSAAAARSAPETTRYVPRAVLVVPIEEVGLFIASSATPGTFEEADRAWAEQLAGHVGAMVAYRGSKGDQPNASDRLDQIAAIGAEDFAEPLTVARGALELAEETGAVRYLEQAYRAIDRIEDLLRGIEGIALADDHAGWAELIELRSAVEEVWQTLDPADATVDVVASRRVLADEPKLHQLLIRLFANAIEHGGPGVSIRVGVTPTGFFVEDDGPGIPPDEFDQIFTWGHTSTMTNKGIGLSLAARIVEALGWQIEVSNGPLGGARFEISGLDGSSTTA